LQLLWAVSHGLESISKRLRSSIGITGPQRLVVRLVGQFVGTSPGELADVLHIDPSSLTGVLRRLERARLVKRRRDPVDARRAILTLTPAGQRLNGRRAGTVEAAVQRTLTLVSANELRAARLVLSALATELDVELKARSLVKERKRRRRFR
jgi:DNA-binding MarR family transcriptional regulator